MSETERQTKKAKVEIGNVENNLKVEKNIKIETKIKVENNDGFDEKESTEKNESNEKKEVMEQDEKKAESKPQAKSSEDGGTYFELSEYRRLAVRKFKGTVMVDIREVRSTCLKDFISVKFIA